MSNLLPPLTVLRLDRLWPHARKQGRDKGQIYRIGYYCKGCGTKTIWLVDSTGDYNWTADLPFIKKHFCILELSKERSIYGKGRDSLGPMQQRPNTDITSRSTGPRARGARGRVGKVD